MMRYDKDIVADTQVVVLMGGLGTRLGLKDCPKAIADIEGIPFFNYQLQLLKRWRFHKFLFLVGYMADSIENYYGDGSNFQVEIQYSYDGSKQLGTGGALWNARNKLEDEFLLIYGDSFMDIDYQETVYRYWSAKRTGKKGIMTILKNEDSYDRSNVVYKEGRILLYDKVNKVKDMLYIDYGVSMLSKEILDEDMSRIEFDLADVLRKLSKSQELGAQVVTKRFYEIGTPRTKMEFCEYVKKRFGADRKAVFLDRDGVINELVYNEDTEWLDSPFSEKEFIYRDDVIDILKKIQQQGYYIFIVSNQPAAAKGKVELEKIYNLNLWIIEDLRSKGISVEFLNVCPHHPVGSPKSKYRFLIRECNCRKPKEGLITDLMKVYQIDKSCTYMVGDSYTDIIAGKKSGIKTVFLGEQKCDLCKKWGDYKPDRIIKNIKELENILEEDGYV
ncbi:D-glycero-beta-D-manno-heptose-1,7-bisphosphate 7-phosphatase [Lachnospiraceae bacterium]|nr:D-glycero-beta-D-manno-heptose-1,7-bisphosphate 7-phosphatase [Lachnospiraceae bacterium]